MFIDLSKNTGLSLKYNEGYLESNDFSFKHVKDVQISELHNQLVNKEVVFPDLFYRKFIKADHKEILRKKKIRLNYFVIFPGIAGIEYVKTISKSSKSYPRIIEVEYGSGIIILQKDVNKDKLDIVLSRIKVGDKVIIPCGYSECIINNKATPFIVSEISSSKAIIRKSLDDIGGLSYYVISKNSRSEIVRNPSYRTTDTIRKYNWNAFCLKYNISPKTPIIKQLLRKYEKFNWLFKSNSINSL